MSDQSGSELGKAAIPPRAHGAGRSARHAQSVTRARLAVTRNTVLAAIVALGCVLVVLVAFNRPLVYRIFPWTEPAAEPAQPGQSPSTEGIYWADTPDGHQVLVADPTLRPDLYVTIEFTWACGHQGSFVPAEEGQYAMYFPQKEKAKLEGMLCPKCRQALEYLEKKKQAEQDAAGR